MSKLQRYLSLASELALNSEMLFKHGAIIVKNGKIIGRGWNTLRSYMYDSRLDRNSVFPSIHAEFQACHLPNAPKNQERLKERLL
jgi:tRNA(Arg) A34 adenosine deaminase TadA